MSRITNTRRQENLKLTSLNQRQKAKALQRILLPENIQKEEEKSNSFKKKNLRNRKIMNFQYMKVKFNTEHEI